MPRGKPYMEKAKTVIWTTPDDLFDRLWDQYDGFDCDPACLLGQHTASRVLEAGGLVCIDPATAEQNPQYLHPDHVLVDGLKSPWIGKVFCNPPWGLALRKWVPYAIEQVRVGNTDVVVMLVPATPETQWWQQYVMDGMTRIAIQDNIYRVGNSPDLLAEVVFIPSRLTFGGAKNPATKGTVLLEYRRQRGG